MGVPQGTICGTMPWKAYVADFHLARNNYIMLVIQHSMWKSRLETTVTHKEGISCTVNVIDNEIRAATTITVNWCEENFVIVNTSKPQHMTSSRQLDISVNVHGHSLTSRRTCWQWFNVSQTCEICHMQVQTLHSCLRPTNSHMAWPPSQTPGKILPPLYRSDYNLRSCQMISIPAPKRS